MIGILDYGSGNLFSVINALNKIGKQAKVISKKSEFLKCSSIILPGVGSYKASMKKLTDKDFLESIKKHVQEGKLILGICLGMQMLLDSSEEDGFSKGLGLISGKVTYLNKNTNNKKFFLPNMGWSKIIIKNKIKYKKLFVNISNYDFYFANSLACRLNDKKQEVAYSIFGLEKFSSILIKDNIIGMQFHPEKSSVSGLNLLLNIFKKNNE
jgi:glutamine amidotransferase